LILVRHKGARYEQVNAPDVTGYDVELHEQPLVKGAVGRLREKMVHRDNDNLHHFFARHNIYSDWEALTRSKRQVQARGEVIPRLFGTASERRRWLKQRFFSMPARPFIYFIYSYFFRLGFLDGRQGFIFNVLKSCYWYQIAVKEYEIRLSSGS
jgi:hypothetical protein